MNNIISEIEKIKYEANQKKLQYFKIKELEELLESPYIDIVQQQIIQNRILELKREASNNKVRGINKLKKFRLNSSKTSMIKDEAQFIYPNFIEAGKTIMFFGESGKGKTLQIAGLANYGLENKTIKSVVFLDFDNGLISLKKRKYDQLSERWGSGKFDYLLGHEIIQEMEPIDALRELVLDGENNKGKMIIIDSGSHFVYDGSKNER